ncbi:MAG: response regulator [Moraxellaceae bacterium]|nr:response regulator [Moraxellaceae bacterium]
MRRIGAHLCFLLTLLVTGQSVFAAQELVVDMTDQGLEVLDTSLSMFRDSSARMTIGDVAEQDRQGNFQRATTESLAIGYTRDAIWASVSLHNPSPLVQKRLIEVIPPRLRDIRLFVPKNNGWSVVASGISVPVQERLIRSRQSVFSLELAPGEVRKIYIRIASGNAILLSARIWQPDAFNEHVRKLDFVNGIQFGAIFLFALYSLLLFFVVRDPVFLFFFISMAACGLYDVAIQQYGFEFLWPGQTEWSMRSPGVFMSGGLAAMVLLISSMLQMKRNFPRMRTTMSLLAIVAVVLVPLQLIFSYDHVVPAANALIIMSMVLSLLVTMLAVVRKQHNAMLMLLGFVLIWLASILRTVYVLGLIPSGLWVDYAQSWTMVLSGSVLAIVVADRVRQLRLERARVRNALQETQGQYAIQLERDINTRTSELREAKESAEYSSRAKSVFLAHMSHEFRTPLHSILGYTRLAMNDGLSGVNRKRLDAVQRSGNHLLALIDELLDYTRGAAGRLLLEPRPVYLQALVESSVEAAQPLAQAAGASLNITLDPSLPPVVLADSGRMHQVLSNLLANACYHSQGSRISLEVKRLPEEAPESDSVLLWFGVRDNGIGIPAEAHKRIFTPFEQVTPTITSRGVGLGLPGAYQLVELMEGELRYEPGEDGGSLFGFTIPLKLADESMLMPVTGPVGLHRYKGRVRRILIVDEAAECRALLADILASAGFDLVVAESTESAQSYLLAGLFDAVIVDQYMSGKSGWQILQYARERNMALPFLLLSAMCPQHQADGSVGLSFDAVLTKPTSTDSLLMALGKLLGIVWSTEQPQSPQVEIAFSQQWIRPSAEVLAPLREALEMGQVTDIEDWAYQLIQDALY